MRGQTNAQSVGGTVGSDTKPIKIVNGVAQAVSNALQTELEYYFFTLTTVQGEVSFDTNYSSVLRYGKMIIINLVNVTVPTGDHLLLGNIPTIKAPIRTNFMIGSNFTASSSAIYANNGWNGIRVVNNGNTSITGASAHFIVMIE